MTKNVARIVATCVWIFNAGVVLWMTVGIANDQRRMANKINALEDQIIDAQKTNSLERDKLKVYITDLQAAIRGNAVQSDYVLHATEKNKEAIRQLENQYSQGDNHYGR